jgi:flagellar biosynthesis/type III secretory pathway chaperone
MSATRSADPFRALVQELELERLHLVQMIALAEEESRLLAVGDTTGLDAISAERLVQLHALELYAARRATYLDAQGFPPGAMGLAGCAAAAGRPGRKLFAAWKRVAEATAELSDLNAQNSALALRLLAKVCDRVPAVTDTD